VTFLDNVEKCCRAGQVTDENIVRSMRITCWIPKATNTHSEYVIVIALLLQQLLQDSTAVLGYTYITCLFTYCYDSHLHILLLLSG
jgi:hypothetical protein